MKKRLRFALPAVFMVIAACAVITVNIYFPERDVQEAYRALEKELMTDQKNGNQQQERKPEVKPGAGSSLRFDFIASAYAQESGMAEKIAEIVRKMPDVVSAYKDMGARIAETDRLRDSGAAGEGNEGLLVPRETPLSAGDRNILDTENENRRTVIRGMAKAIVRVNRVPETPENMSQVMPQATEQFAKLRRDAAKKGWWIQDANGNWSRK
jgi:hypothetical protein